MIMVFVEAMINRKVPTQLLILAVEASYDRREVIGCFD